MDISNIDSTEHWNKVFRNSDNNELGWYEDVPIPSIKMIERSGITNKDRILIAGAGTSTLVKWLLENNYNHLIINDISSEAITTLKKELGYLDSDVHWVVDDLTRSTKIQDLGGVNFWLDRAVFHFITEEKERNSYLELVKSMVLPGGFIMMGTFAMDGARFCTGLPVVGYSSVMMMDSFGDGFTLISSFNHMHYTPTGQDRPYTYTLIQRN